MTEEKLTEATDGQHPCHCTSYMNPVKFVTILGTVTLRFLRTHNMPDESTGTNNRKLLFKKHLSFKSVYSVW